MHSPLTYPMCQMPVKKRGMLTILDHTLHYRTRLLDKEKARAFAKCLSRNPSFRDVSIVRGRWGLFVAYRPANPDREGDLLARLQLERVNRALSAQWEWEEPMADGSRFVKTKGGRYRTNGVLCSCEDARTTCRTLGLRCKHAIGFQLEGEE
jgi:hypothetical protein